MKITHKIIVIIIIFIVNTINAQRYAEFSIHKTTDESESLKGHLWYINNQKLDYNLGKIRVKVNEKKLDTILYKNPGRKMDTIYCNFSENKYEFLFNPCCGGFNFKAEKRYKSKMFFKLKHKTDKTIMGVYGARGMILKRKPISVKPEGLSAMAPNYYLIKFVDIELCKTFQEDKNDYIYLLKRGRNFHDTSNTFLKFKTIAETKDLLYMPLSSRNTTVIYDPKTDTIEFKLSH